MFGCSECNELLFANKWSTMRRGDKVLVSFEMCEHCVTANCRATTNLLYYGKPYTGAAAAKEVEKKEE